MNRPVSVVFAGALLAVLPLHLVADEKRTTSPADTHSLVEDDFSSVEHSVRKAVRGEWKIANGMASVEHDDALYKKHKNHGPILIYNVTHNDATAVVDLKPTGCRTVVFTMDAVGGGHAFRVKLRTQGKRKGGPSSTVVTYGAKQGDEKAKEIVLNNKDVPKLVNGEWNRLEVTVSGRKATVKLGNETVHVEHPRIDQEKKIAKLGFAYGKLSVRTFTLSR